MESKNAADAREEARRKYRNKLAYIKRHYGFSTFAEVAEEYRKHPINIAFFVQPVNPKYLKDDVPDSERVRV